MDIMILSQIYNAKITSFIFSLQTFSGCAVAFMFILVLVGLAICRFHIKRRWSFRYYTNSASNESESSIPSGSRIISSINIRQGRRCQRTRRSRQHLGMFIWLISNLTRIFERIWIILKKLFLYNQAFEEHQDLIHQSLFTI